MRSKRIFQTMLAGLFGLALLVGLNVVAAKFDWRVDLTIDQRNTLTPEAVNTLQALDSPVRAIGFYMDQEPGREGMLELFEMFVRETDNFSYEFVDPDANPMLAREMGVTLSSTVILANGDKTELVQFPDEETLINALVKVTDSRVARFAFSTGHGELDPDGVGDEGRSCSMLQSLFLDQGVEVSTVILAREEISPDQIDALLILGPETDFLDSELDRLTEYFQAGGRVFLALAGEESQNLEAWAAEHLGLVRHPGLVVNKEEIPDYPMVSLGVQYGAHAVTEGFVVLTLFPTCAALDFAEPDPGRDRSPVDNALPLVLSSRFAWVETNMEVLIQEGLVAFDPASDIQGPLMLAGAYEGEPVVIGAEEVQGESNSTEGVAGDADGFVNEERTPRAVVFGDQDFLADQWITTQGNIDMARNSVNWLLEREARISVTRDQAPPDFLLWPGWQLIAIVALPFIVFIGFTLTMVIVTALKSRRKRA
ncbi:MAG: hypothetical protein D6E12_14485 [Desulfovibrio sp.]|nr:MAG: hypothetical protein D6E12_14485 [Desulfovibrio sp.]